MSIISISILQSVSRVSTFSLASLGYTTTSGQGQLDSKNAHAVTLWLINKLVHMDARQGKNGQGSGVYRSVHEHSESIFNVISHHTTRKSFNQFRLWMQRKAYHSETPRHTGQVGEGRARKQRRDAPQDELIQGFLKTGRRPVWLRR